MRFAFLPFLAALALMPFTAARAEGDPPPLVYNPGPIEGKLTTGEITAQQREALYRPRGPRPGYYRLRVLHSGYCLNVSRSLAPDAQERLKQYTCQPTIIPRLDDNFELFAFVPHPAGGHSIRVVTPVVHNGRAPVPGQLSNCVTSAPGVVFGPARIEARGCEVPGGESWTGAGNDDQRFLVQQMAPNAWELRFAASNADSPDCIAVRGGSRDLGTDLIRWGCNGNADQRFMLEWVMPLAVDIESATLARRKWYPFADGPYWLSPANGVDLTGTRYSTFETIADGGQYCMRRCAELTECKAWTWTAAGYRDAAKPICTWRSEAGRPIHRGRLSYGKIFSGIVR